MPKIEHIIRVELDPTQPVQEICEVISALTPPPQEKQILQSVHQAIADRLAKIEKEEKHDGKPIRESRRNEEDQG